MQAHAKLGLVSAVLTALTACAGEDLSNSGSKPSPRPSAVREDPYGNAPSGFAGAGQLGKAGTSGEIGGSAGKTAGTGGGETTMGGAASGAGNGSATSNAGNGSATSAGGSAGLGGNNAASATGGGGSAADCPSLTLARLPNGGCVARVTEFDVAKTPTNIVTGGDRRIWVDDDESNRIIQLNVEGRVTGQVDCEPGSSPRALVGGAGDALLWYTDSGSKTLVKLSKDRKRTLTPLGFEAAALALGADDEVFLTEFNRGIYRVLANQPAPTRWESRATDAIVVSPDNQVWVSEGSALARLIPGLGLTSFPLSESAYASSLCLGPDSGLWFSDGPASQLVRMNFDGSWSRTINLPTGTSPARIITGPDGALWFAEAGTQMIGRVTLKGEITHYPLPTPNSMPDALTVGPDDNIWFTERFSHKVGRLIPDPLP